MIGPHVYEVLANTRAIVSTEGLRRVVVNPSGKVLGELMEPEAAAALVGSFNRCGTGATAEAVTYDAEAQMASS